jgi:CheY-like chemotaxis protein
MRPAPSRRLRKAEVAAAERHRPDLMIVDLKLAVGTGIAAVERITRAGPIPHVFMSGLGPLAARPGLAT